MLQVESNILKIKFIENKNNDGWLTFKFVRVGSK